MKYADKIRRQIDKSADVEKVIREACASRSRAYAKVLELNTKDLSRLEQMKTGAGMYPSLQNMAESNFLSITVEKQQFVLVVKHVCDPNTGWSDVVMAICTSNWSINNGVGHGTTFVTIIEDAWHAKLMNRLEKGDEDIHVVK